MKQLAILLNIVAIITISYFFIDEIGYLEGSEYLVFLLFFATPIINIIVIVRKADTGWFSLYLKRKELEEKRKIQELQD